MISPGGWKEICKEMDRVAPRRPFSKKVQQEMYAGRRQLQTNQYQTTMPAKDFDGFCKWVKDWMTQ